MPIEIIVNTINTTNSTDSQSFVSSNTADSPVLVYNYTGSETNIVSVSKDSSPCYGLCCPKDKCKNNN